jgi:hypothetical protein
MNHLCSGPTCERTTGARRCSSVGARAAPFSPPAAPGSGTTTGPTTGAQQTPRSSALCAPTPRPARRLLPRLASYYYFSSPVFYSVHNSRDHKGIWLMTFLPQVSLSGSIFRCLYSVADPRCLSRIRIFPSRIQDQKDSGSRIRIN